VTRWRVTLLLLGVLVLIVVATSLTGLRPTLHAPASARQGTVITVTATQLRSGAYSLLLVADHTPHAANYCDATLDAAQAPVTQRRFVVRIPRRIPCFRGSAAVNAGSVTARGDDELLVAVLKHGGVSNRYSSVHRSLRIS
jgi:hypothetical protein